MATPTYAQVLTQINTYIVANGNNEITGPVLNAVLDLILDFANNNIGDLDTLTTDQKNSVVEAINSLKQNFDDLVNNGVQLYTGIDDPNVKPPPTYKYADFYMQIDSVDSSPIILWQWDGFNWVQASEFEVLSNKVGVFTVDGTGQLYYNVDYINSAISTAGNFPKLQITATAGQTVFPLGTSILASAVFWNGAILNGNDWSQSGSNITITFPASLNDLFQFT